MAVATAGSSGPAGAQGATPVDLSVTPGGEEIRAEMHTDLDGLLLGTGGTVDLELRLLALETLRAKGPAAVEQAVAKLEAMFRRRVRIRFDGRRVGVTVSFPARRDSGGSLLSLGWVAVVSARVPEDAKSVSFFASRAFRSIDLTVRLGGERIRLRLLPGEESRALELSEPVSQDVGNQAG